MYFVDISQGVLEDKQLLMLEYLASISDKASVSRYYNGYIEESEFEEMQKEYRSEQIERAKKRLSDYASNDGGYKDRIDSIFKTNERVMSYFDDLEKQELQVFESVTNEKHNEEVGNIDIDGIISTIFTRTTQVTEGPIQQMIYLRIERVQEYVISKLKRLYDFPYEIQSYHFEDLALYREEKVLLAICSHEEYGRLYLDENEARKLVEMGVLKKEALLEV